MSVNANHIGPRIQRHRLARGLRLEDVAQRVYGKPSLKSYFSRVEGQKVNPRMDTVERIATMAFGMRGAEELWQEPNFPATGDVKRD